MNIIKTIMKKIFGCHAKWRRKTTIGGSIEIYITCDKCFAEFILQNFEKVPVEWQPICPYCNTIIYVDEYTKEEMFKEGHVK